MAADGTWDGVLAVSTAHTSTPPTSPAAQGAGWSYKNQRLEPPDHGFGRSRGGLSTKIHHLVDGHGLPLVIAVTAGQAYDAPALLPLLTQLGVARPRTRPDQLRGDKAYDQHSYQGQPDGQRERPTAIPRPRVRFHECPFDYAPAWSATPVGDGPDR